MKSFITTLIAILTLVCLGLLAVAMPSLTLAQGLAALVAVITPITVVALH